MPACSQQQVEPISYNREQVLFLKALQAIQREPMILQMESQS